MKTAGLQNILSRDVKGMLAASIEGAKNAAELSSVVLELEAFMHQIQEADKNEDLDDQKLAKQSQALQRSRLERHDWWLRFERFALYRQNRPSFLFQDGGSNGVVVAAFSKCARPNNPPWNSWILKRRKKSVRTKKAA